MFRILRGVTLLAFSVVLANLAGGRADAQSLPPAPVPVGGPAPSNGAPPPSFPPPPRTEVMPAPGTVLPASPGTGLPPPPPSIPSAGPPVSIGDPMVFPGGAPVNNDHILDSPQPLPGWFGAIEIDILKPHIRNGLSGTANFPDGGTDQVGLPGASLSWTASPRFELGYRMADGCGEFVLGYRFFGTDGKATIPNYDVLGDGELRSRLSLNVWDFDYGTRVFSLGSRFDFKWRLGVRLEDVYFDSRAVGQFMEQKVTNRFVGAGPHIGLDMWYHLGFPGLSLFARTETAVVIGSVRQGYEESFTFDDGSVFGGAGTASGTQTSPMLNVQVGVSWTLPGTRFRVSSGYQYEHWWNIGRLGDSRGDLWDQGFFFRGELNF
jgi:hypothetical protein